MKSLFVDDGITKVAARDVSDNNEDWPQEVKTELLEKAPFVGRYDLGVDFNKVDEETSTALGSVTVSSGGDVQVRLPFVIREGKLLPIDLIAYKGTLRPLTEARLSEALFRPQLFDGVVKDDDIKPTSMVASMSASSLSGRGGISGNINKLSSLILDIKSTIAEEDLQGTVTKLANDKALSDVVFDNPATLTAVRNLHEAELTEKTSSLSAHVRPTVMQITYTKDSKYRVKTANPKAYSENVEVLERAHALAKFGSEVIRAVDNVDTLTFSTDALIDKDKMEAKCASATTSGVYKAIGLDGNPVKGILFTKIADLDGRITSSKLFVTGNEIAIQEDVVGEKLGSLKVANLPRNSAAGMGVFYWSDDNGLVATVPLIVHSSVKIAGESKYEVSTLLSEEATLIPSRVKELTKIGSEVLMPEDAAFMSLPGTSILPLASKEDVEYRRGLDKTAKVNIRCSQGRFYFSGGFGLDKLANTEDMSWNDAMFLATCLGMHPEFAETKLAQAIRYPGGTSIRGLRDIKPLEEYVAKAREKLANYKDPLSAYMDGIRQDLWKEAAQIDDENTVDKMLSLGYINPENINVFLEYLPSIEGCQRKLCELLVASRIGLKAMDEQSLSSAIEGVEKAITGLKVLLHTKE